MNMNHENTSPVPKVLAAFIAFYFAANLQIYVPVALKLDIRQWHQIVPIVLISAVLGLLGGSLKNLYHTRQLDYLAWYVLLIVIAFASLVLTTGNSVSGNNLSDYALMAGLSCGFLLLIQKKDSRQLAGLAVAVATALAGVVTVAELLLDDFSFLRSFEHLDSGVSNIYGEGANRIKGLHFDPNRNGHALVLGMFISQFFIPRPFRFAFCLFIGVAVLATFSRSSLVGYGGAMLISTILGYNSSRNLFLKTFFVSLVLGGAFFVLNGKLPALLETAGLGEILSPNLEERISGNFFEQGDDSTAIRVEMAELGWRIYTENPIFGVGLDNTTAIVQDELAAKDMTLGGLHNTVLKVAAELGTIGVLAYLLLLAIPLRANSLAGFIFVVLYFYTATFAHTHLIESFNAIYLPLGCFLLAKSTSGRRRRKRRHRSKSLEGDL